MMDKITAVIPVKKESGRLPGKNIMAWNGTNLLINKIRQLKAVGCIQEILVSSDSDEMLEMAETENVRAVRRPDDLADESRPFSDFVDYITDISNGDIIVWACVTSPLVDTKLYRKAIKLYSEKTKAGYDSLVTVYPFKHFLMDENGTLNFQRGRGHKNSQDLPRLYLFTNGIIIASKYNMRQWEYHFGPCPYYMEVSRKESVDIDDIYDYKMAVALNEKEGI